MKLQPGDYYLEDGNWVFTEQFLLRRGWCCNNGCRHCPYKENLMAEEVKCPMCGRKKAVIKQEDHLYYCTHCQMQFDDREDE